MPMKLSDFKKGVIGKLEKKFEVKETSSHHVFYEVYYKGRKVVQTYCSHGSGGKEISDDILQKMKRQLGLNNLNQLYDLRDCPMSAEDYYELLKRKNVVGD